MGTLPDGAGVYAGVAPDALSADKEGGINKRLELCRVAGPANREPDTNSPSGSAPLFSPEFDLFFGRWVNQRIVQMDDFLRGHCQADDCYELAAVSDAHTSLAYCAICYCDMRLQQTLKQKEGME